MQSSGQAGLLDVALHPDYETTGWIYFSYTEPKQDAAGEAMGYTVIARARLAGHHLQHFELIYQVEKKFYRKNMNHVGSRIVFDHEGYLYFTIGDRTQRDGAQDVELPGGKIHRLHDDGRVPEDNPCLLAGCQANVGSRIRSGPVLEAFATWGHLFQRSMT